MKTKLLLLFVALCPLGAYCQSVDKPVVGYSEDMSTRIAKVEVTKTNTVVTFINTLANKGAWVQLNKSIYLQDAKGEAKYNYVSSEGIPLRPDRFTAEKDNQEVQFKVYFEKLKPGTKEVNIIERARSMREQMGSTKFFNFYNVSLSASALADGMHTKITDVVLIPPPPLSNRTRTITDTAYNVGTGSTNWSANIGPMMGNMYSGLLDAQLKMYSKPDVTDKLARITKNYYDALIKVGFTEDAALKIVTSKSLVSMDGKQ